MQSENLECQIAQAQMGRYLGGEGLSQEAITELETHVRGCAGCKDAIQARRRALESVLSLPTIEDFPARTVKAAVQPAGMPWVDAIRRMPTAKPETGETGSKKKWRTPVMTAALAGVLILMTNYSKEPTRVFGDRAMTPQESLVKPQPSVVADNRLAPPSTEGESPITIEEPAPSFQPKDFIPAFILNQVTMKETGTVDMALTRQIMELELEKYAAKEAKAKKPARRKSRNVVRVYAPE
jgi:hypothetical protein